METTLDSIQTIIFHIEILQAMRKIVQSIGNRIILLLDSKYLYPNTGNADIRTLEVNIKYIIDVVKFIYGA